MSYDPIQRMNLVHGYSGSQSDANPLPTETPQPSNAPGPEASVEARPFTIDGVPPSTAVWSWAGKWLTLCRAFGIDPTDDAVDVIKRFDDVGQKWEAICKEFGFSDPAATHPVSLIYVIKNDSASE